MRRRAAVVFALGLAAAALAPACQCGFDAGKLDDLACRTGTDCRPDQDCIDDTCTQRPCESAGACGDGAQYACIEGFCVADSCDTAFPCRVGFECRGGLCVRASDAGVDAGVDAAVPCADPSECDDGLDCTDDVCADGFCSHDAREGTCAIDGACWAAGAPSPEGPCQACDPAASATRWTPQDDAIPSDGIDCTVDSCAAGEPRHVADDARCGDELCSPCAGGCVARPELTVDCPDLPASAGGAGASCTVSASPAGADDASCISCTALVGITSLVRDDFEGCPPIADLGWQGELGGVRCPAPSRLGPDRDAAESQLEVDDRQARLERFVDASGFDAVRLCFDLAYEDWQEPSVLAVELNTTGNWTPVWTSDVLPVVEEAWHNACLDLVALDPLAAGNAALGIRLAPADAGHDWNGRSMYLDNVTIDAWDTTTVSWPGRVFTDGFTGCALDDWTVDGAAPSCPAPVGVALEAAAAQQGSWTISRAVDLTDRCDDLRLGFSLRTNGSDLDEELSASVDRGAGPRVLWGNGRGFQPDGTLVPFEVNVSAVEPALRLLPNVTVSLSAGSQGALDALVVDDVWLDGAQCSAAPQLVSAAPAVATGQAGQWSVEVAGSVRSTAHLACTWEGRLDTQAADSVLFCEDAECAPGTRESLPCGQCGTQTRRCDTNCRWLDWSACNDLPCSCCDPYGGCVACCC